MARPKIDIDPKLVEELASIQCTLTEIGAVVGCDASTVQRRFAKEIAKGKESGKMSLRRIMWKHAETHYAAAIFLSKNYIGLRDKPPESGGEHYEGTTFED